MFASVLDPRQVRDLRLHVQLLLDVIGAAAGAQARHRAPGIVQIPEGDGLRGAALLAGGADGAVAERPRLAVGLRPPLLDALHAHRALLHDAAAAHHDVGVQHHALHRIAVRIVEPVDPPHLRGTVVRAVPRPDAPVVALLVQPLARVDGGQHRADRLAGRVLAVLAHHGLVHDLGILGRAGVVALDAQPVHHPPAATLELAHHRDVVLGVARHHTGGASGALRQIDGQAPAVPRIRVLGPPADPGGVARVGMAGPRLSFASGALAPVAVRLTAAPAKRGPAASAVASG